MVPKAGIPSKKLDSPGWPLQRSRQGLCSALLSSARHVHLESVQGYPGLCHAGGASAWTMGTSRNFRATLRKPQGTVPTGSPAPCSLGLGLVQASGTSPKKDGDLFFAEGCQARTPDWKTVTHRPHFADLLPSTDVYKTSPGPHLNRRHFEPPHLGKAKE